MIEKETIENAKGVNHMSQKYKHYKKENGYSYTLGIFLTIELLQNKPEKVIEVLIKGDTTDSQGIDKIKIICEKNNIPYRVDDKIIERLSPKGNTYALGVFTTYNDPIESNANHIVMVNPSDSGNLGTIIRAALGFQINNLAIIRPAVDIFDPKTIRASMGSLFSMNFTYYNSFDEYQKQHKNHHFYPFMLKAKKKLKEVVPEKPFGLVFGNEATGLDDQFLDFGMSVIIPHAQTIDSLNLSVAASIAMYEFTKEAF